MEKATPKVLHEISMRVDLKAGKKYAIVPSPRKAGTLGKFHLSFYTSAAQHEFDVKRVDDPRNTCKLSTLSLFFSTILINNKFINGSSSFIF